jgi:hypothetical protein
MNWAARLLLAALIVSLASCQNGGDSETNIPKGQVTDPNVSFTHPATRSVQ